LRLADLMEGGVKDGDHVVVVGSLEKRIAFYAWGEGGIENGAWSKEAIAAWNGPARGVVQSGEEKISVLEAGTLYRYYYDLVSGSGGGEISGGVVDDIYGSSKSQAEEENRGETPPDAARPARVDVMVVERSESLRNALGDILAARGLEILEAEDVEEALQRLEDTSPGVIVSEFRTPSMAAKVLVDRLREAGREVPVLVTTSHRGRKAELLVEKLGAAGYISKPLDRQEVWEKVGSLLSCAGPSSCAR